MLPYDFLPFGSRRCSQSKPYKSFREHNSTSSGLQMFNRSTAQQKLLLMQVRWIIFDGADAAEGLTSTASCFVVLLLEESVRELCTPLSTALQLKRGG